AVVRRQAHADAAAAVDYVSAGDLVASAFGALIDGGLLQAQVAATQMDDQIAIGRRLYRLRAVEGETDPRGVGAGADDQVGLELPLPAVVDQIDSRVDVAIRHLLEIGNAGPPLRGIAADQVVAPAGQLV